MPTNRYGLANYEVTVTFPSNADIATSTRLENGATSITIGGVGQNGYEGSYIGSVKVTRKNDLWSTEDDPTGSWVHTKNLGRSGTVDVEIWQVSDQIVTLAYSCQAYESIQNNVDGLTIEVKNTISGVTVAKCYDCLITKIPDQEFGENAVKQTWTFTCGRVMYFPS